MLPWSHNPAVLCRLDRTRHFNHPSMTSKAENSLLLTKSRRHKPYIKMLRAEEILWHPPKYEGRRNRISLWDWLPRPQKREERELAIDK